MRDLIDRQAAIDVFADYIGNVSKIIGTGKLSAYKCEDVARRVLGKLPSVQPEPQWIPCSERLPEPDERVLVYTVANEYHVWDAMPHRADNYVWEDEEGLCHSLYEVDLWMPLPEPARFEELI